jgi:hypothetical protein
MSSTAKSTSSTSTQVIFNICIFLIKAEMVYISLFFLPYYVPISNQCVF